MLTFCVPSYSRTIEGSGGTWRFPLAFCGAAHCGHAQETLNLVCFFSDETLNTSKSQLQYLKMGLKMPILFISQSFMKIKLYTYVIYFEET